MAAGWPGAGCEHISELHSEKIKKIMKKGLTNRISFGMIIKLAANGVRSGRTNANLENDTEQRNAKRQMIPMSEGLLREREIGKGLNGRV